MAQSAYHADICHACEHTMNSDHGRWMHLIICWFSQWLTCSRKSSVSTKLGLAGRQVAHAKFLIPFISKRLTRNTRTRETKKAKHRMIGNFVVINSRAKERCSTRDDTKTRKNTRTTIWQMREREKKNKILKTNTEYRHRWSCKGSRKQSKKKSPSP